MTLWTRIIAQLELMLCFADLLDLAAAKLLERRYALKERHAIPNRFQRVATAPAEQLIRLHVGLKHGNFEELERQLYESKCKLYHVDSGLSFSSIRSRQCPLRSASLCRASQSSLEAHRRDSFLCRGMASSACGPIKN